MVLQNVQNTDIQLNMSNIDITSPLFLNSIPSTNDLTKNIKDSITIITPYSNRNGMKNTELFYKSKTFYNKYK